MGFAGAFFSVWTSDFERFFPATSGSFRLSCSDAHPSELASLEPSSASSAAVSASEPAVLGQSSFRREASNLRSTRSGALCAPLRGQPATRPTARAYIKDGGTVVLDADDRPALASAFASTCSAPLV